MHRRVPRLLLAGSLAALAAFGLSQSSARQPSRPPAALVVARPFSHLIRQPLSVGAAAPSCVRNNRVVCIRPVDLRAAYDLGPLYAKGLNGAGHTIVLVDSFGSPTIGADLRAYDQAFGLPAPPHFRVLQPAGPVPPFNPRNATMQGWAVETSLDVEIAHAVAPGANLVLVETPVAETEGIVGIPQMVRSENYVINHGLGDVISQSWGATEETFSSRQQLLEQRSAYLNAAAHNVTVLAATGDFGATDPKRNGVSLYPFRTVAWPASDPLVTAVGATVLQLNGQDQRVGPDAVASFSGGGRSHVFARPSYQDSVQRETLDARGIPDVSIVGVNAAVHLSFPGIAPGFYAVSGTSQSCPEFAGIVAIADQAAGHSLGLINPSLYALGSGSPGLRDVTVGNNTIRFVQGGRTITVRGFQAVPGYDLASGLGTPDAARLVPALAG